MTYERLSLFRIRHVGARLLMMAASVVAVATGDVGCKNSSPGGGEQESFTLAFIDPPVDTGADQSVAIKIGVRDATGGIAKAAKMPITVALGAGSSSGTLSGTRTVTTEDGFATFSDLAIDAEGTYTLEASSPSISPVRSQPFTVTPQRGWFQVSKGLSSPSNGGFVVDPQSTNEVYFNGSAGAFKSTTGGQTWPTHNVGLPYGAKVLGIDSFTSTIYALHSFSGRGWRSDDDGASWEPLSLVPSSKLGLRSLVLDPTAGGSLWASTWNHDLYHSSDGGRSWSYVNTPCFDVEVDRGDGKTLFCGATRRSIDRGVTFETVTAGLSNSNHLANAQDAPESNVAYSHFVDAGDWYMWENRCYGRLCGYYHLYRLAKGAMEWTTVPLSGYSGSIDHPGTISGVTSDPSNPSTVYFMLSDSSEILKSVDGGKTVTSLKKQFNSLSNLTIDPKNSAVMYADGKAGPFKSTDGGDTWTPLSIVRANLRVRMLAAHAGATKLYAVVAGGLLFQSTDAARSWSLVPDSAFTDTIVTHPEDPKVAWRTGDGFFRTSDGGATWWKPSGYISANHAFLSSGGILWGADQGRIWRSIGGIYDWTMGPLLVGTARALAIDPSSSNLYAATDAGLVRAVDGKVDWSVFGVCAQTTIGRRPLTAIAVAGANVYAGSPDGQVFVSTDGGETCTPYTITDTAPAIAKLTIDPDDPNGVFAATSRGLYRTQDGGKTWTASHLGLPDDGFSDVIATPALGKHTFFAASERNGLFKTTNAGE